MYLSYFVLFLQARWHYSQLDLLPISAYIRSDNVHASICDADRHVRGNEEGRCEGIRSRFFLDHFTR